MQASVRRPRPATSAAKPARRCCSDPARPATLASASAALRSAACAPPQQPHGLGVATKALVIGGSRQVGVVK